MKYFVLLVDGAADEPIEELEGKTVLEYAKIETANRLANLGKNGKICTVPVGIVPSSDSANLCILGYDPKIYLTGRAPLEAAGMGIAMEAGDVAFRAGSITLVDPQTGKPADKNTKTVYEDLIIGDYSASQITTSESSELIKSLSFTMEDEGQSFYSGISYRHCMIMKNRDDRKYILTPPHDALGRKVGELLPEDEELKELQKKAYEIMRKSPINAIRIEKGLNPANALWFWGQGTKPDLPNFEEKYKVRAAVISAVDLIRGIAICAGIDVINVEGATGDINTNYKGKAGAAIEEFKKGKDLVYLHLEAPDECGHQGDLYGKIKSLELIDRNILKPVIDYFTENDEKFKVMILPDHKTPVKLRVHTEGMVPFVIYDSEKEEIEDLNRRFNEKSAEAGLIFEKGYEIMEYFLNN